MSRTQRKILGAVLYSLAGGLEAAFPEYSKITWAVLGPLAGAFGLAWAGEVAPTGPTRIR